MRFLFAFLLTTSVSFAQVSKYNSLLWKISGNGLKKPSYLYGTMHVSNRVAWHLTDEFFSALKSVQVVGLETHPGEWLNNMQETGELAEISKPRSNADFNQDFYANTFTAVYPDKKILQAILSYDPDIINGLLYRQNKSRENFEENTYIDLFIYQSASKLNKEIISLENFSTAEIQARLSAVPDEENAEHNNRSFYGINQKIEDAYRTADLDLLDSLSKISSSQNTQKYLINERNHAFVRTIDSVLKTKTLFSGVGAAHLPGEEGVIELLRKMGYTLEPVKGVVSKKGAAAKDALDQKFQSLAISRQFATDSLFSLELPGKLYPIFESAQLKYYIHPDMVNGNYYSIVRFRHMGSAAGWGPKEVQQRLDSLLFEYTPGKILKKENISNSQYQGIELLSRTARGDEQRYQIYFTDNELIMIKLGGKGDYAGGKEASSFFSGIHFENINRNNFTFSPPAAGFSINVTGNISYFAGNSNSGLGLTEEFCSYNKNNRQLIGIDHAVYNDFSYLEEDTFELARFTTNILRNYVYKRNGQFSYSTEQGLPSVRFTGKNEKGSRIDGKVIIKGVHYYFLYQITPSGATPDFASFDSFKLTRFKHLHPIKEIRDREFLFKVKDEITLDAASKFNERYAEAYKKAFTKKDNDSLHIDDFRSGSKLYNSPSNNEYVSITFERYNSYDYRNRAKLEKKIADMFKNSTGLLPVKTEKFDKNGLFRYNCVLSDTATSRAIRVQLYFKNSTMHELSVPYDTVTGIQGWAASFLESFEPIDSAAGPDLFTDKFPALLKALASSDTSLRQKANDALTSVNLVEEQSEEFVRFIGSKDFDKVNEESRAQLLVSGGTLKNNKIIQPYRELYKHYTDSFFLQLCVLKGLALLKNQEAFDAFANLITTETPLVGEEFAVADVFGVLHDSLDLCKKFFPQMLDLTRYEEYKSPVYALLSELVLSKKINDVVLEAKLNEMLMDANLALKRYSPASKQKAAKDAGSYGAGDRLTQEISDLIRQNLESLANNQEKSQAENAKTAALSRPILVSSAISIIPFCKTEPRAKQLLDKITALKEQEIIMPVLIGMLKHGINPGDSILSEFSRNEFTRAYFYSEVEKENLTQWFDKKYLSQQSLVISLLQSHKQISSHYSDKEKSRKDSLILIAELPARNKYQKGKMYVYRSTRNKSENSLWCAAFLPETRQAITSRIEIITEAFYPDQQKTEQENLDLLLDQFALKFRKRAAQGPSYED